MFRKKEKEILKRGLIECPYCRKFEESLYMDDDLCLKIERNYLSINCKKDEIGLMLPIKFCPKCGKELSN